MDGTNGRDVPKAMNLEEVNNSSYNISGQPVFYNSKHRHKVVHPQTSPSSSRSVPGTVNNGSHAHSTKEQRGVHHSNNKHVGGDSHTKSSRSHGKHSSCHQTPPKLTTRQYLPPPSATMSHYLHSTPSSNQTPSVTHNSNVSPKTQHGQLRANQNDKLDREKELRDNNASDATSPIGAANRVSKDSISPFGSGRGVFPEASLFSGQPSVNPFMASGGSGFFGNNLQSLYLAAAAGIPYPYNPAMAMGASTPLPGIMPFSYPDYFYPPANYFSALQEAYSLMGMGSGSREMAAAAAMMGGGRLTNLVASDRDWSNGRGCGAYRGEETLKDGVGPSTEGGVRNGIISNPFNFSWMKV